MKLFFTQKALRNLKRLEPMVQKRIREKLNWLMLQEDPLDFAEFLVNFKIGTHRFRIGDYRVIFKAEGEHLIVVHVGSRREIYRR